jgi:hypothetical protein
MAALHCCSLRPEITVIFLKSSREEIEVRTENMNNQREIPVVPEEAAAVEEKEKLDYEKKEDEEDDPNENDEDEPFEDEEEPTEEELEATLRRSIEFLRGFEAAKRLLLKAIAEGVKTESGECQGPKVELIERKIIGTTELVHDIQMCLAMLASKNAQ